MDRLRPVHLHIEPLVSREEGFTLVEALVATTLTVALVAIAFSGFVAASRATERGLDHARLEDAVLIARQQIARDLLQATRVVVYSPDSFRVWNSVGTAVTYARRDSSLARGQVGLLPVAARLSAFRVQAIGPAAGDTLLGLADTEEDEVEAIRVRLQVRDDESTTARSVSRTVDVALRTQASWPVPTGGPAWPESR